MGEQKLEWLRLGVNERSSAAAEKDDEGMALKIRTRAEGMSDGEESNGLFLIGRFSEVAEHIHDVSHSAENDDNHQNRVA